MKSDTRKRSSGQDAKKSHKLIEKERRQRINDKIEELRIFIEENGGTGVSKKSQILQVAIDSIDELRVSCNQLIEQYKKLKSENDTLNTSLGRSSDSVYTSSSSDESDSPISAYSSSHSSPTTSPSSTFEYDFSNHPSDIKTEPSVDTIEILPPSSPLFSSQPSSSKDISWLQDISHFPQDSVLELSASQEIDIFCSSLDREPRSPLIEVISMEKRKRGSDSSLVDDSHKRKKAVATLEQPIIEGVDVYEQQVAMQDRMRKQIEEQQAKNQQQIDNQISLIRQFQMQKGLYNQPTLQLYLTHLENKKTEEEQAYAFFQNQMMPIESSSQDLTSDFQPLDFLA